MARLSSLPLPLTGITQVDAVLDGGYRWAGETTPDGRTLLTVFHATAGGSAPAWEDAAFDAGLAAWAAVARLGFVAAATPEAADIRILTGTVFPVNQQPPGYAIEALEQGELAFQETPFLAQSLQASRGGLVQSRGYYNTDEPEWSETGLQPGGNGFWTVVHELGHALSLAHPFDEGTSGLSVVLDNPAVDGAFTALDYDIGGLDAQGWYRSGTRQSVHLDAAGNEITDYGYVMGPAAIDIAAIQHLYGANTGTATGDDVYLLPDENLPGTGWATLWDAGGVDEIRYDGARDSRITLQPFPVREPLTVAGANAWISQAQGVLGGVVIADDVTRALTNQGGVRGVVIENATGGAGSDVIRGNAAGNILRGREGADRLRGERGDDSLDGGPGADRLRGGGGADTLSGGDDGARDVMAGGAGADLFMLGLAGGRDVILGFTPGEDRIDLSATGVADFAGLAGLALQVGADLVLRLGPGAMLVLRDVTVEALSAADVLFA